MAERKRFKSEEELKREEARAAFMKMHRDMGDFRTEEEICKAAQEKCYFRPEVSEEIIESIRSNPFGHTAVRKGNGCLVMLTNEELIDRIRKCTKGREKE